MCCVGLLVLLKTCESNFAILAHISKRAGTEVSLSD